MNLEFLEAAAAQEAIFADVVELVRFGKKVPTQVVGRFEIGYTIEKDDEGMLIGLYTGSSVRNGNYDLIDRMNIKFDAFDPVSAWRTMQLLSVYNVSYDKEVLNLFVSNCCVGIATGNEEILSIMEEYFPGVIARYHEVMNIELPTKLVLAAIE